MLIIRPLHYIIYYDNLLNMNKQGKITPLTISTPPPQKKTGLLPNVAKAFIITLLENNHIKAQMIKKKTFLFFPIII